MQDIDGSVPTEGQQGEMPPDIDVQQSDWTLGTPHTHLHHSWAEVKQSKPNSPWSGHPPMKNRH